MTAARLETAIDELLSQPLRELVAVTKLPPIPTDSAHGFLSVEFRVATGGAAHAVGE